MTRIVFAPIVLAHAEYACPHCPDGRHPAPATVYDDLGKCPVTGRKVFLDDKTGVPTGDVRRARFGEAGRTPRRRQTWETGEGPATFILGGVFGMALVLAILLVSR